MLKGNKQWAIGNGQSAIGDGQVCEVKSLGFAIFAARITGPVVQWIE